MDVTIVNITPFGAFAALVARPELEGLIHISELGEDAVAHPDQVVAVGDQRTVRVISVKPDQRRIAFSLKSADPAARGLEKRICWPSRPLQIARRLSQ